MKKLIAAGVLVGMFIVASFVIYLDWGGTFLFSMAIVACLIVLVSSIALFLTLIDWAVNVLAEPTHSKDDLKDRIGWDRD